MNKMMKLDGGGLLMANIQSPLPMSVSSRVQCPIFSLMIFGGLWLSQNVDSFVGW
jgi:hypothetical protein